MLINKIIEFTALYNLVDGQDEQILVGVSAGVDSMVMLNALHHIYPNVAVAHCNFSLRAGEADSETNLVIQYCKSLNIKCHNVKFDTPQYCASTGLSTQIACRELRYDFFEKLCNEFGYTKIAIAHNLDDCIETQLINSLRGASLKGFASITPRNGRVIRPMMSCSRFEVLEYANSANVPFLNDSSNNEDKYLRNKLRHHVVPQLREMSGAFYKNAQQNFENLREDLKFQQDMLHKQLENFSLTRALTEPMGEYLLYKFVEPMGFNRSQAKQILRSAQLKHSGAQFYSNTKQIIIDRNQLVISDIGEPNSGVAAEMTVETMAYEPEKCYKAVLEKAENNVFRAYFDADKICDAAELREEQSGEFGGLRLRLWENGDRMEPFGMRGSKNISDILVDAKISLEQKRVQNVVVDRSGVVLWLVGLRTSARFAVSSATVRVAMITVIQ